MIRWYYYFVRWVVLTYFRIFTRLRVEGLENVPEKGPVLIVANHLSNSDPPLISVTMNRNALFMAKEELFRNRMAGYFIYGLGAFPVRRGQTDRKALRHAENVLKNNLALVMFPEAARSKDAQLHEAYPGSALIASRHDVPIVPVALTGTENLTNWRYVYRRYPVTLKYGKAFRLPKNDDTKKKNLDELTRIIMEHIAETLPERYRGFYAQRKSSDGS